MKLDYTLSLDDWKATIRLHSRQKIWNRIRLFIGNFIIPAFAVMGLGCIAFAISTGQSEIVDSIDVPVTVLVVIAILFPILRNFRIRKSFKGMFPPSVTGPGYSLDIDDERILSTRIGFGEAKYYWAGICSIARNNRIMILYLSEILFICIPIYKLSPDQRFELNDLVARNMVRKEK